MTATTSDQCMTCRRSVFVSAEERQIVALHRMEHLRADRRRAQYRASKARRHVLKAPGAIGSLHDLGCHGPGRCSCRPIPVYAQREDAA